MASVDPIGLVTGKTVGSATITATQAGIPGSTVVTVTSAVLTSIAVSPANPSIAKGTTVGLTATCTFSDGTTPDCTSQVDWTSSNLAIAQVSNVSGTQGVSDCREHTNHRNSQRYFRLHNGYRDRRDPALDYCDACQSIPAGGDD